MGSNRFYILLCVYVILIFLGAYGCFYFLLVKEQPNTAILVAIISILVALRLIYHLNRTNRLLANFLTYMKEEDTSLSYTAPKTGNLFRGLQEAMDDLIREFKYHRIELEVQARYLEAILDNVSAGIICYGIQGEILVMNSAASRFLGTGKLSTLGELEEQAADLVETMRSMAPGNQVRHTLSSPGRRVHLLLQASYIKLKDRPIHILALNDISHELEEQEIRSWKKLIRVINHEIMNSITPIITLSRAIVRKLGKKDMAGQDKALQDSIGDAVRSATIIEERSDGLVTFINRYKELTGLPPVKKKRFAADELMSRIEQLFSGECESLSIRLVLPPSSNAELDADCLLLEQVLINLLKNSIEAVKGVENPEIELTCVADPGQGPCLCVRDNGTGIPGDKLEQVFVPFFTTREDGSGIGLSLCRQIMRQHNGNIQIESTPGKGTTVSLTFP